MCYKYLMFCTSCVKTELEILVGIWHHVSHERHANTQSRLQSLPFLLAGGTMARRRDGSRGTEVDWLNS